MSTVKNLSKSKHLDLGCSIFPKNPYAKDLIYGIDIAEIDLKSCNQDNLVEIKKANLIIDDIPYPSNFFDSVSAYDFLEHIPRIIINKASSRNAFIEIMNEIFRVLKDGGRVYAQTPFFPNPEAFVDPTHVNFITNRTHTYFCIPKLTASMYGFNGKFKLIRVKPVRPKFLYEPNILNVFQKLSALNDKRRKKQTHLIWEFEAIKN
jgi:SAM-dependent methyltransferase